MNLLRSPKTIRIGTLQLLLILFAVVGVVLTIVGLWVRQSQQLAEERSKHFFHQRAIYHLHEEVVQWRQFDRVVSALEFLSNGRLKGDDLLQTSRLLYGLSRSTGIDPLLVLAVVSVESQGNPWAVGRFRSGAESGAVGLMQIKLTTAQGVAQKMGQWVGSRDLLRPDMNLLYGTAYLLQMVQRYGSLEKGLIAYNIGPGTLEQTMMERRRLPQRYYNRVLSNYRGLQERFGGDPIIASRLDLANPRSDAE